MNCTKNYLILLGIILLFPGCGRFVDWGKKSFSQISPDTVDQAIQENYIRSVVAYHQITTVGKFDALWLSSAVRKMYSKLLAKKCGKTEEQYKTFLRRQLEENKHFITFYVLSLHEYPLGTISSEWTVFLSIDGDNYAPIEIKAIELAPEYMFIFGKKYNNFKVPYSVKFDARTIDDEPLIDNETKQITLHFHSVDKELVMHWDLNSIKA